MPLDNPPLPAHDFRQAVIFDVDGTLLDDDNAVAIALKVFRSHYREWLPIPLEELTIRWKALLGIHFGRYLAGEISMQEQRRARLRDLFAPSIPVLADEAADAMFTVYEQAYRRAWTPFPDAVPALEALRSFRLAVLTNGDLAFQVQKLQSAGLLEYFPEVFASSEAGFAKPHPEAFELACRRLGVEPGQCVHVGDNLETDAKGSARAGLMSVWLDRTVSGGAPPAGIQVIHDLSELPLLVAAGR